MPEISNLVDTHCHLNLEQYEEDREEVIQRAKDAGVKRIIIPAIDYETCLEALALAEQHDGIYVAVGIHPNSSNDFTAEDLNDVCALAETGTKVVAIGEIGLDYYWDFSPKQKQMQALEAQLELALSLSLPVIIHNRDSSNDLMNVLEQWANGLSGTYKEMPGVLHSFSAPPDIAERALASGFYLGFTGPITFKKADELREIAQSVPLDRILVETDGPYLTPAPYRGKRNEPAYIPYMVEKLAELHQITPQEMGRITTQNAKRLFHLN